MPNISIIVYILSDFLLPLLSITLTKTGNKIAAIAKVMTALFQLSVAKLHVRYTATVMPQYANPTALFIPFLLFFSGV